MEDRFLQINLNNSRVAQDMFTKNCRSWNINIALVAEPNCVPPHWIADNSSSVAIACNYKNKIKCVKLVQGNGIVVAGYGDVLIIACYLSPNLGLDTFLQQLDTIAELVRNRGEKHVLFIGRLLQCHPHYLGF